LDTREPAPPIPARLAAPRPAGAALGLVQFVGPIQQAWLERLEQHGVRPVQYIEHNAYLVWADAAGRETLEQLAAQGGFLQYSGPYHPYYKLGPSLREPLAGGTAAEQAVPVTIQILDHAGREATEQAIVAAAVSLDSPWQPILGYRNVQATLPLSRIAEIAARPDVTWVGERFPRERMDEVQGQIVAAQFDASQSGPAGPGYKAFLDGLGFSTNPADYPVVDVTDDGIGTGLVANGSGDPTFTRLGDGTTTRLVYIGDCTTDASGDGVGGHGHINTSIVGGYDVRAGSPYRDSDGFQRGMGLNPYGRMAGTKIFQNFGGYDVSQCGGNDAGVIASSYTAGGRISSNSWGCAGCAGSYDDGAQAYDAGTRDALPGTAGNQELLFVFAAGNSGPGSATVGTPGNGKNMITVGASENDRPTWTDGCAVGPTGADDAMDVIDFSSRGPSPGGRKKPEVIAPGTHIQGTASTNGGYDGSSVCDQFLPSGQTVFAASSGTSHSTPAVAGVASLYYRWLQDHFLNAVPSPALLKAYMMTHTTYLTGVDANDTLPSNSQGYGMPNLEMAFDTASRYLVDQSVRLDNSGETWTFNGSVADPSLPVRIVLVYTDAPGAIGTSPQVNNLDLGVTVNGTSYKGNVFSGQYSTTGGSADTANNYEGVFLPAGTAGALDITVSGFNIAGDGVPGTGDGTDQDFALVCYNCAQFPDFTLVVAPPSQPVCAPADAVYSLSIGSILGFNEPATLTTSGLPAGATSGFSTNPVTPPGASQLSVHTAAVSPGSYAFNVVGTSATKQHSRTLGLTVFNAAPAAPALLTPADGATNQPLRPAFSWSAVAQADRYDLQIASDAGFSAIVHQALGLAATSYTPPVDLPSNTPLYWRVRATNPCGDGALSAVAGFVTQPLPGDCPLGGFPIHPFSTDFEAGSSGWTVSGSGGGWTLSTARANSASHAFFAPDIGSVSDQQLVSPAIELPSGLAPLTLQFYNWQQMERRTGGCYDGGILEISTSGPGGPWTQLEAQLLTDPYDGPVSSSYSNPLSNLNAWCGDPQDWTRSIVALDAYAGQTVHLRFRLGTDSSVNREGWYVDDVSVQACLPNAGAFLALDDVRWTDAFPPGNGNGIAEPGERLAIEVDVKNVGSATATGVHGTLSLTSGSGTVLSGESPYADLGTGETKTNGYLYTLDVAANHPCGSDLTLQHVVGYNGPLPLSHAFVIPTGQGGSSQTTYAYSGPPVSIPDNNAAGVDLFLNVPAATTIGDLDVGFGATHTYDGDLLVRLFSPAATSVTLSNRRGGSDNDFVGTIFDDEAATAVAAGTAPFTGRFRPDTVLSAVDGQSAAGTWRLNVSDLANIDTGTVSAWSLTVTQNLPVTCAPAAASAAPPPVPDGAFVPGARASAERLDAAGSSLHVTWDSQTCTAANYNLYYGLGGQLPASVGGTYGLSGSLLALGPNGAAGAIWSGVPDPAADPDRLLWWVIVATDGAFTEGSWGHATGHVERSGPAAGGASGQGAYQTKVTTHSTCP
ncbi:MAG TPA: S8 family serine peptidase, partial [Candidatus Polarisedimenticolaceae bacterium]|nr:S8 family serine peptidase [Candidatus Polarisedimenticolaceae bacterium]